MAHEHLQQDGIYHIYNRGNNGEDLFKTKSNYFYFVSLLKLYLLPYFDVFAYALLPNHFHLVLRVKSDSKTATQKLSNLFNAYTKAINKSFGRTGSLFQKPFRRKRIESEEYLRTVLIYIHQNPQNHGITQDFSDYEYSSYKIYIKQIESFLNKELISQLFDDLENFIFCHQKDSKELLDDF